MVKKLRAIHLYLGCVFAPLLLFFAVSGIWQLLGFRSGFLHKLSSIHTQARWKDASELGSLPLRIIILLMALSFIATTILGVVMAFKMGQSRRAAVYCLAAGVAVPAVLVLYRMFAIAQ